MLEQVTATRYVVPLREGGSLPGVVEADDLGTYVLKFRGAGQGLKVLVAEVIVGELARGLGLPVPRLVEMGLPEELARYEADEEVQDLLRASVGSNLGVDLLPGALGYDGSRPPGAELAAAVVWLDALTANPDRTWANPNLLVWHRLTWLIDHGAALYFHHGWPRRRPDPGRFAAQPYRVDDHVLGEVVDGSGSHRAVREAHDRLAPLVPGLLPGLLAAVPDGWLEQGTDLPDPEAVRSAYRDHLLTRLEQPAAWLPGGAA